MSQDRKQHWENVYHSPGEVSWTQQVPQTSLDFIHSFGLDKSAKIIDVGGGDSNLVDHLLDEGFEHITVLDISAHALEKAKQRLGSKAERVHWIVSDVILFRPEDRFDLWHDRATFHFLTNKKEVDQYIETAENATTKYLLMGTFSDHGPKTCSGLQIQQYNAESLSMVMKHGFEKLRCITEDHITPFHTKQNFLFCSFKRRQR